MKADTSHVIWELEFAAIAGINNQDVVPFQTKDFTTAKPTEPSDDVNETSASRISAGLWLSCR
jgi:hypothetical protein